MQTGMLSGFRSVTAGMISFFLPLCLSPQVDTLSLPPVFELGEVRITARTRDVGISEIGHAEMQRFDREDVAGALQLVPGLSYVNSGPRNEATVLVRGFDLRQVPVYLDGIPVYITYDGYVDLGNYLSEDIARISVSKGVSSVLFGPNTLGGAINIVTRKPGSGIEFDGSTGLFAGRGGLSGLHSGIHTGIRMKKSYVQAGYSILDRDPYPLSGKRQSPVYTGGGVLGNSDRKNIKLNLKAGWMPNATDEYAVSLMAQQGKKGIPVYGGSDPNQRLRYWRFPDVHNRDVSFFSKTAVGRGYLKARLFYDQYYSDLRSFDDSTYSTQDRPYAFTSIYFDDSFGSSLEYNMGSAGRHDLKGAFHYKYDHHREHNIHPVNETVRHMKDQFVTLGVEDNLAVSPSFLVIGGAGLNYRDNIRADNYNSGQDSIFPFPANRDIALNGQIGLVYQISEMQDIRLTLARKTRFATMKDRYSYRLGMSIPNPTLKSESAIHLDLSHSLHIGSSFRMDASVYYSLLGDAIQPVYGVDTSNSAVYQFQNTGRAVFYGLESDIGLMPIPSVLLGVQYTWLERKNLSRPEVLFTDVPGHRIFGYVKYEVPGRFYILLDSGFNSERYSTSDGQYVADAFFLSDLKASVEIPSGFSVEAGIDNLLDAAYSYYEGYPQEGRNFTFSVKYSFSSDK